MLAAISIYVHLAVAVWHPGCGTPTVEFHEQALTSTALGWTYPGTCTVHLPQRPYLARTWPKRVLCHAILHEVGHLAGAGHSTNEHSVMYPNGVLYMDRFRRWHGMDKRCLHPGPAKGVFR